MPPSLAHYRDGMKGGESEKLLLSFKAQWVHESGSSAFGKPAG